VRVLSRTAGVEKEMDEGEMEENIYLAESASSLPSSSTTRSPLPEDTSFVL
jgi:hypothetical protein